jgi:hypothetical protein
VLQGEVSYMVPSLLDQGHAMSDPRTELDLNRGEMLESAGVLAAAGVLLSGANAPGAQVEDRVTSLKIAHVKASPVGPKAFVKIESNHPITGWGEIRWRRWEPIPSASSSGPCRATSTDRCGIIRRITE